MIEYFKTESNGSALLKWKSKELSQEIIKILKLL